MGFYINPPSGSKEDFLKAHGSPITDEAAASFDFTGDSLPVCWIYNGQFTAAGIAYEPRERDAFISGMEGRHHHWFFVSKTDLEPYYRVLN